MHIVLHVHAEEREGGQCKSIPRVTDPFLLLLGLLAELSKGVVGVGDGSGSSGGGVGGEAAPRLCVLQLHSLWLHTAIPSAHCDSHPFPSPSATATRDSHPFPYASATATQRDSHPFPSPQPQQHYQHTEG